MASTPPTTASQGEVPVTERDLETAIHRAERDLEAAIREYGEKIFALMDAAQPPSLFSKKGFYGTAMDWAMRDEHFKTQLFRFVDVLPTLGSSGEVARHLKEYLGDEHLALSPALRARIEGSRRGFVAVRPGRQGAGHRHGAPVHARQ